MNLNFIAAKLLLLLLIILSTLQVNSQTLPEIAEGIRKEYKIPELGYAVVSSDSVLEIQTLGFKQINSKIAAEQSDRFHLGSNTKAITGFLAALLVKQNKLNWQYEVFRFIFRFISRT